jgi:hypothetical protein
MQPGLSGHAWIERVVASQTVRATYASLVAHVLALLLLALLVSRPRAESNPLVITLRMADARGPADDAVGVELAGGDADGEPDAGEPEAGAPVAAAPESEPAGEAAAEQAAAPTPPDANALPPAATTQVAAASPPSDAGAARQADGAPADGDVAPAPGANRDVPADPAAPGSAAESASGSRAGGAAAAQGGQASGEAFGGRSGAARARGVAARGGSAASEAAVARGLEWLARHQAPDGSWRFDLSACRCDGACRNPGSVRSTTAATGIALLPFLGAGQTHERGEHAQTVTRGLYYLMSKMQATPRGGDLSEGTMYGHGVATLALAEALGMTRDRMLVPYVRDAVRFLETSQDMHGGGWRYLPGQPGDTTVTAWQLAALKSAALAGVEVPSPTIHGICEFLDRVQVHGGEGYGYIAPQKDRPCTSAIGLLCRIYTAWPEQATLDRGLAKLAARGPDREAVYQNFYLSQALLLRNHPAWPRWNAKNRDQLVARQDGVGHEAGSWSFADADTAPGGRLGHTALAILTLEVYYRLLPIYTDEAAVLRW